jgi:hypothetical protein
MAAITPHPAPAAEAARAPGAEAAGAAAAQPSPRAPAVLGGLLLLACAVGAFASGAARPGDAAWLQAGLAALGLLGVCMAAAGAGVRARTTRLGAAGPALLLVLAAWTALTLLWSVAPDQTWLQANRALSYVVAAGIGLAVGASLPRALGRAALGGLVLATVVALYALGGKALPGVAIPGVLDLDHTALSPRLRAPVGYANGLAFLMVLGVPLALVTWDDPRQRTLVRLAALAAGVVLVSVLGMTHSRGAIVALVAGLAVLLVLGRARGGLLAGLALVLALAAPVLAVAFTLDGLTDVGAPRDARQDDGLLLLAAVVGCTAAAAGLGWVLLRRATALASVPPRVAGGIALGAVGLVLVAGVLALAVSDRGLGGSLSHAWDDFRTDGPVQEQGPGHLLSTGSGHRWAWWQEALGAWSDEPVGGWGGGSFPVTHLQYRADTVPVARPHSVPLQALAETGVVGLALLVGALGLLLAAAVRGIRALPDGTERQAGAALAAVAVAWALHGLVEWHWDLPGVTVPVMAALGLLAATPGSSRRKRTAAESFEDPEAAQRTAPRRVAAVALASLALSLVAISSILPGWADGKAEAAQELADDPRATPRELLDAAAQADLATRLNPAATRPRFVAAAIAQRRGRALEAREQLLEAVDRQPQDAGAWRRLARLAVDLADMDGAVRASRRALALDPRSPAARELASDLEALRTPPGASATATGTPLNTPPGAAPLPPPPQAGPQPQPDLPG